MEKYFQVVAKEKKALHFKSVVVLSIFLHKNIVFSEKKRILTLNLSQISRIRDRHWHSASLPKYATGCTFTIHRIMMSDHDKGLLRTLFICVFFLFFWQLFTFNTF